MKRLALVLVLAATAVPASAPAAGCRPLDCAPSGSELGHGLFAVRPQGLLGPVVVTQLRSGDTDWQLPSGVLDGRLLVHQEGGGPGLTWFDVLTGRQTASATVRGPAAYLAGASQDGRRAVLSYAAKRRTTFVIVSSHAQRSVTLPGANWGFDALADTNLYLLRYLKNGYQVRRYDLAANRLVARPLKDPHESSLIWGTAWARASSPDGRYVFTLYVGPNGAAMVHELDVRRALARCVDLPGTGDFNAGTSYAIQLSPDGRTLWAVSPGYGRVVAVDVRSAKVRVAFRIRSRLPVDAPGATVSAISPRGDRLAAGLGSRVWVIDLRQRTLVMARGRVANALAFSPDGSVLWTVRGQVFRKLAL